MENSILPVEAIQERDIDLILLEELSTDITFAEWFVCELQLPILTSLNGTWKSMSQIGLGETDILFSYVSDQKKIFLLIENKLDAIFQNEQFDRYEKRAQQHLKKGECDEAYTVLFAPQKYCETQNDFDNFITYESVANRLEFTGSKRNIFKSSLLKIAIEKLRRGYRPINSPTVHKFWQDYYHFKQKEFPSLYMKKPGIVPHNSDWPMLFDSRLKGVTFLHKLRQGNVDATFYGFSEEMEYKVKQNLPTGAKLQKHNKSFSIRIFSGKIDRTKDFEIQKDVVKSGLDNIIQIRDWIIQKGLLHELE
jgi:hypothetical protein